MREISERKTRNAVSTMVAVVVIIVIIVVVAAGVLVLSPHGTTSTTTSSSSSSTLTTSSSSSSPLSSSSTSTSVSSSSSSSSSTSSSMQSSSSSATQYSGKIIASFADPDTPLAAPNLNMSYPLAVNALGNLPNSILFQQTTSQGITLDFTPANVSLSSIASNVQVLMSVAQNVNPGNYNLNTVAEGGGGNFSIPLQVQVVKYLVGIEPAFTPANLTVPQGSTVTWIRTNGQIGEHGSNGSQDVVFNNGMARSPQLLQWQSFSFTFNQTGSFPYTCTYQVGESGEVTVVAP